MWPYSPRSCAACSQSISFRSSSATFRASSAYFSIITSATSKKSFLSTWLLLTRLSRSRSSEQNFLKFLSDRFSKTFARTFLGFFGAISHWDDVEVLGLLQQALLLKKLLTLFHSLKWCIQMLWENVVWPLPFHEGAARPGDSWNQQVFQWAHKKHTSSRNQ